MPWLSRRPRTTLASMSDGASENDRQLIHRSLQNYHRNVVVLRLAVRKRRDFLDEPIADRVGRQQRVRFQECGDTRLSETVSAAIHRLADTIGEKEEQISSFERDGDLLEASLEPLAVVKIQPDNHAVRCKNLGAASTAVYRRPNPDERAVAGARARQCSRGRSTSAYVMVMKLRLSRCREMMRFGIDEQRPWGGMDPAERQHQPLQLRHVERRRHALSRHVRDEQHRVGRREAETSRSSLRRLLSPARTSPQWKAPRLETGLAEAATSESRVRCAAPPPAAAFRPARSSNAWMRVVMSLKDVGQPPELVVRTHRNRTARNHRS